MSANKKEFKNKNMEQYRTGVKHLESRRPPPLPPPVPFLLPPLPPLPPFQHRGVQFHNCFNDHHELVFNIQKQREEWECGFDAYISFVKHDPNQISFEKLKPNKPIVHGKSIYYMKGLRDAESQWNNVEQSKNRCCSQEREQIHAPSICYFCWNSHPINKPTTLCMDTIYRINTMTREIKDKKLLFDRGWFNEKKSWIKDTLRPLPKDVGIYGKLIPRKDACSFLFCNFPDYAIQFEPHEVVIPHLTRQNYRSQPSVHNPTVPVIDEYLNASIPCAICCLKLEVQEKPVVFDRNVMQYVDCDFDMTDLEQTWPDDCYVLKNAILFKNKPVHFFCKPNENKKQKTDIMST